MSASHDSVLKISAAMNAAIIGQETVVERLLIALLTGGNVLMEGLPGTAKTRSIKTLSRLIQGDFSRVQFTPDLLPSDVTGSEIYREKTATFEFQPGPIFGNLVLADEINRAPAKVQAALLEAMEEHQVTVAGILLWLLILLALTRPQWLEPPIERSIPTRDLLLLVDLSGSMEEKDFTGANGKAITRLEAVKEVLGDFLIRRKGDRVGLVVFGNSPFLQVPFTTDLELCRQLLDETAVRMAGPRTALGDAIGLGIHLFENSDAPAKTIIALTDGNDTASSVPPVEAARVAKDRGIKINTIAMGNPKTVGEEKLDQVSLREVAQETGGSFFLALDRSQLVKVYAELDKIETRKVKTVSYRPRRDLYYWPLALALMMSLASHIWLLLSHHRHTVEKSSPMRLKVNPRTFELEAIELSDRNRKADHAH